MITVNKKAFEQLYISTTLAVAVQDVRNLMTQDNGQRTCDQIISHLLGTEVTTSNDWATDLPQSSPTEAEVVYVQYVVQDVLQNNMTVDSVDQLLARAKSNTIKRISDPSKRWMYVAREDQVTSTPTKSLKDFTIDMYRKLVVDAKEPITNVEFVARLVKERGVSKSCATTYAYMARTKLAGQ